ncbi:hypothetical protein EJB05_23196 [Eragrostis curvula]|uniref:Uncharacterized protein n=1 Tax=Eragrostis curvula TaxID=38414 RepID=A0A5J9V5W2_9POAL|nr:hypothetical protein EJB05_23196 [Eragrostis curvula]
MQLLTEKVIIQRGKSTNFKNTPPIVEAPTLSPKDPPMTKETRATKGKRYRGLEFHEKKNKNPLNYVSRRSMQQHLVHQGHNGHPILLVYLVYD